ncbi:ABC transporter permease [Priestia endophytica]|jgi:oligopeptide transport system permease protein|uniref:Diguanylate cyclase n=2 Tax=Priestia endophytica TaxID=135735 RepID=A0AAX1Q4D6_9BACI|nr:ABC transporter permease [Priestia endophytica]KAB2496464.1 ABC transporter permease [Priestia endophytica]KYG31165.1 diguanylate cyclase [Priestia endophytica]MBG9810917.1 diguanylate cyclase [Priestia endophytica]MBG9813433.1 diguanylate cyclase [Priestia endophytica]MCM3536522.1 ABC transporter permease [Priestia endophytica]
MQQIPKDMFEPVSTNHNEAEKISKPSLSFWKDAFLRYRENKLAMFGTVLIILLLVMAIFAPVFSKYDYETTNLLNTNQAPSSEHWFGTDDLGRDIFVRTWEGARISLFIGLAAAFIDLIIGVIWGSIAGFRGGKTDEAMMRIADILWAIPYLLMVVLLMVILDKGLLPMIIAMSITGWINMARIVRGQVLQLKNQEFVLASQTLGAKTSRLLFKHLIPNSMGPILVTMTLTIPSAIFTEAFLSYLGLGVPAPLASWGTMATEGVPALEYYPWRLLFPATFICLTIFAFNVIGDGLRDALDPKQRK